MEAQYKKRKDVLVIAAMLLAYACYFISVRIPMDRQVIHAGLDDLIPFCEFFIIAYVWWYVFISGPLLWFFWKSREDFLYMGIYLLMGMWFCVLTFFLYPTCIDFQPEDFTRDNAFTSLVGLIYASDKPVNVFPSMHCFESAAVCVAIWKSKRWGKSAKLKAAALASAVLICLSTVLVKQHSVYDAAAGILLAAILYFPVYKINWTFCKRFE